MKSKEHQTFQTKAIIVKVEKQGKLNNHNYANVTINTLRCGY